MRQGKEDMIIKNNLLNRLIRLELEKINISKKYVGFKYLTEILVFSFDRKIQNEGTNVVIETANLNGVSVDAINHDIKHMFLNCCRQNDKLCKILNGGVVGVCDIKSMLNNLVKYIHQAI